MRQQGGQPVRRLRLKGISTPEDAAYAFYKTFGKDAVRAASRLLDGATARGDKRHAAFWGEAVQHAKKLLAEHSKLQSAASQGSIRLGRDTDLPQVRGSRAPEKH